MVGPIPTSSTLAIQKANRLVGNGYIELSGTSFAAPVISGIAAQVLARNPSWTPDQVKSAVMRRARPVPGATQRSCGVGQVNAVQTVLATLETPNPNKALNRFLTQAVDGSTVFDAVSWTDVSWSDVSWDAVSWTDVSWSDVSWDAVSWSDVSWTDVSWSDVSWSDVSWEDNAEGETAVGDGYELTPVEAEAAADDVDLLTPDEKAELLAAQAAAEQAAADAAAAAAAAEAAAEAEPEPEEGLPPAVPTLP
jgi:Subtilase family